MTVGEAAVGTWEALLHESVDEVFGTMLGGSVAPVDAKPWKFEVTAILGLAGTLSGSFVLQCSRAAIHTFGACLLGPEPSEGDCIDAVGELCNMLAGAWKRRLPELAEGSMLSIPTVVTGGDYQIRSLDAPVHFSCSYVAIGETIQLSLLAAEQV